METEFAFADPGKLVDDDLELVLVKTGPADPARGYVPWYEFEMRRIGSAIKLGELSLRIGEMPRHLGHIRYRVLPGFRGSRYAARACRLIIPLARHHNLDPVWIACRPDNLASRRTCELAGATYVDTVSVPPDDEQYRKGVRHKCKYRLETGNG